MRVMEATHQDSHEGQIQLPYQERKARMHMKHLRRLSLSLPLLVMSGCTSWGFVEQVNWNAVSIVVSLAIAGIGWYIASEIRRVDRSEADREKDRAAREQKLEKERAARENALEEKRAARDEKRDVLRAFDRYRRELMGFTDEVIGIMGSIQGLLAVDPSAIEDPDVRATALRDYSNERDRLMNRVSSLIERGRFFFPNLAEDDRGTAQYGLLDPVLNRIVAVHYVLRAMECGDPASSRRTWDGEQVIGGDEPEAEHIQNAYRHLSVPERSRLYRKRNGFSLADLIISARRSFVDELFDMIQPRQWLDDVDKAYGIQLSSRQPEAPNLRRNSQVGADIDDN